MDNQGNSATGQRQGNNRSGKGELADRGGMASRREEETAGEGGRHHREAGQREEVPGTARTLMSSGRDIPDEDKAQLLDDQLRQRSTVYTSQAKPSTFKKKHPEEVFQQDIAPVPNAGQLGRGLNGDQSTPDVNFDQQVPDPSKHPDAKNLHKASLISFNGNDRQKFQKPKLSEESHTDGPPALKSERKLYEATPGSSRPRGDK